MPINPDAVYREEDGQSLFGFSRTQLKQKIKDGDIPAPVLLAPAPSRARGWFGATIIAWREKVAASQHAWKESFDEKYQGEYLNKPKPVPTKPVKPTKRQGLKRPVRSAKAGA